MFGILLTIDLTSSLLSVNMMAKLKTEEGLLVALESTEIPDNDNNNNEVFYSVKKKTVKNK